jgi:environmental stress-induced protein Ves
MTVIRWADRVTQPWRNGGGVTHELLREPADGPFAVRLSIAEVAADGPFSLFPGVDRVILLLEGAGFRLSGRVGEVTVDAVGAPFAFAGEDEWHCALLDGAVRDFNVMVDRGVHRVSVEVTAGPVDLGGPGFVLALEPMQAGGAALDRWDLLDGNGVVALPCAAVVVRLGPVAGPRPRE